MRALLAIMVLFAATTLSGCAGGPTECRHAPGTPRISVRHDGNVELDSLRAPLEALGWTLHEDSHQVRRDRIYAGLEANGTSYVLAIYDARASGGEGMSAEAYALDVTSRSEQETRETLAPTDSARALLVERMGPAEAERVEGLAKLCGRWDRQCEPDPVAQRHAPWEREPTPSVLMAEPCAPAPIPDG